MHVISHSGATNGGHIEPIVLQLTPPAASAIVLCKWDCLWDLYLIWHFKHNSISLPPSIQCLFAFFPFLFFIFLSLAYFFWRLNESKAVRRWEEALLQSSQSEGLIKGPSQGNQRLVFPLNFSITELMKRTCVVQVRSQSAVWGGDSCTVRRKVRWREKDVAETYIGGCHHALICFVNDTLVYFYLWIMHS